MFVWVNVLDSDFGIRVILMDCQSTNCYNVWWHLTEVHPVALEASLGYTGALSILFSEKHIVRLTNYVKVKGSSTLSRRLHSSAPQKSSTEYRPRCYMAWAHIAPYLPSQLRNKYQHQNEFSGEPFHFFYFTGNVSSGQGVPCLCFKKHASFKRSSQFCLCIIHYNPLLLILNPPPQITNTSGSFYY